MIAALDRRGIDARPTCPASTCSDFYRERFGTVAGEFPVAEDVSRRSLALPFFPAMTEAVVERVVGALADVLGRRPG